MEGQKRRRSGETQRAHGLRGGDLARRHVENIGEPGKEKCTHSRIYMVVFCSSSWVLLIAFAVKFQFFLGRLVSQVCIQRGHLYMCPENSPAL